MDDRADGNSHYYWQLVTLPYSVVDFASSELNYPVVDLFSDCCPPDISTTRFRAIVMVFLLCYTRTDSIISPTFDR